LRTMRFPAHIATDMMKWQLANWWHGAERVPVVLMLEPLHTCNLACIGCSPERWSGDLKDRLPLAESVAAVDQCGAPVVSICGGEPTIYPELPELVAGIIARKRHIYLCTNALLLDRKVFGVIAPNKRLMINVHLDGMEETHDRAVERNLLTGSSRPHCSQHASVTSDSRFYLSSLVRSGGIFATMIRQHWYIENRLHWSLDVTFNEDHSRIRKDHAAENMASLRGSHINARPSLLPPAAARDEWTPEAASSISIANAAW